METKHDLTSSVRSSTAFSNLCRDCSSAVAAEKKDSWAFWNWMIKSKIVRSWVNIGCGEMKGDKPWAHEMKTVKIVQNSKILKMKKGVDILTNRFPVLQ